MRGVATDCPRRPHPLSPLSAVCSLPRLTSACAQVVRTITGLGLKEAKEIVEAAPKTLKEGASKEECEEAKGQLEEAGAVVAMK